ncbi:hypothetical protein LTR01_008678 [Friedmanniomyces endolithicus]|nr:hypothetical protein LTR01_008678 [Friedmanniomyces endolithicus]KAK0823158.1 hypothetical protein LTR73_008730 [Friedmanniomyces endolithicus]
MPEAVDVIELAPVIKGIPFLDYDWLLLQNNDLLRHLSEQRKSSQHQTVIFNDISQRLAETTRARDQIELQRQALWSDNNRLKCELAQIHHTLAVARFQHAEDRKNALLRDELGNSLQQEALLQRDFTRLTTEHLAQMSRVSTVAVHAPETVEARRLLASNCEALLQEYQRLREELPIESDSSQQHYRTSLPRLAPAPMVHAQDRNTNENLTTAGSYGLQGPRVQNWAVEHPRKYVKAKKGERKVPQ